jgi:Fe-S-cluster containining protein
MASPAPSADTPWYRHGLRFRCTACGECCTGAPGHVWVEKEDIERMAKALGLSRKAYERKYVRRVGRRKSLRERENGDCVMLGEGDRRCRVYAAKPSRCSTFPFWPEVIESPESWRETAQRCEGIDAGDSYPLDAIERLLSGDATPLLERQAAPDPPAQEHASGDADGAPAPRAPDEATWTAALAALEEVYADLAREMPRFGFTCAASGACCDFDAYGHRLYATTLEAEHFFRNAPRERANDDERSCPAWGKDRLCHARGARMLGCRTYFCGPYPNETPEEVHERYFPRIRALHDRFAIPYAYRDIVDWARERR